MGEASKGDKSHLWKGGGHSMTCLVCKNEFFRARKGYKYCGRKCASEAISGKNNYNWKHGGMATVKCLNCNEDFFNRSVKRLYCSRSCSGVHKRDEEKWKNSYKSLYNKGNTVSEHRYVMSYHLGRRLDFDEVVHHINGNKRDNRLENLELMSRSQHTKQHHEEGLYKPMGWSRKWSHCRRCGTKEKRHVGHGCCYQCFNFLKQRGRLDEARLTDSSSLKSHG